MRRFLRFSVLVLVGFMVLALSPARNPKWTNVDFYGSEPPLPAQNIPASPQFMPTTWSWSSTPICYQPGQTAACDQQILQAINHAHSVEGIPPISLAANYSTLPFDVQQFIIVNLERTSFGETPITGITASLDSDAEGGVQNHTDPTVPNTPFYYSSNWYGSWAPNNSGGNPLMADYIYMYEDGWGGSTANTMNGACTTPTSSGCWGHRKTILWQPGGTLSFGAAVGPWGNGYSNADMIVAQTTPAQGYTYTWAQYLANTSNPTGMCSPSVGTAVGAAADPSGGGWVVGSNGEISTQGNSPCYGSLAGQTLNAPIVGIAATPDCKGYWLVASDGGVFSFGNAVFYGSMGGKPLNKPIVGMAATPDGKGYWLVASDGGIFTFGDAKFDGSMGEKPLNRPIVGMAVDVATGGYWEVASDGGIFSFNAPFFGSMGGKYLAQPIVGMDALSNGQGYRFVASDGGVFDFGAAGFLGSMGGKPLSAPVVGMAGDGSGYWLVGGDGGVFSY